MVLDVERATDEEFGSVFLGQLKRETKSLVRVGRAVHAHDPTATLERSVVAHHQRVLLDLPEHPSRYAAELAIGLAADSMPTHHKQVVRTPAGSGQLFVLLLVFTDDASVLAQANVAPDGVSAVVLVGDVGVEADETGEAARADVGLAHDLLVVDALKELAGEGNASGLAALLGLVQKRVGDELEALLDQLVVDLALALDLCGRLELRGESSLQLTEANVV